MAASETLPQTFVRSRANIYDGWGLIICFDRCIMISCVEKPLLNPVIVRQYEKCAISQVKPLYFYVRGILGDEGTSKTSLAYE